MSNVKNLIQNLIQIRQLFINMSVSLSRINKLSGQSNYFYKQYAQTAYINPNFLLSIECRSFSPEETPIKTFLLNSEINRFLNFLFNMVSVKMKPDLFFEEICDNGAKKKVPNAKKYFQRMKFYDFELSSTPILIDKVNVLEMGPMTDVTGFALIFTKKYDDNRSESKHVLLTFDDIDNLFRTLDKISYVELANQMTILNGIYNSDKGGSTGISQPYKASKKVNVFMANSETKPKPIPTQGHLSESNEEFFNIKR